MFEIKAYTRKELATLYFPSIKAHAATKQLRQLLINSEGTENLIRKIARRRLLTKQEVTVIVSILGEP